MIRIVKKIVLSALSILGISFLTWTLFLLNPNFSYANQTQIDNVTIYHNQELEKGTELIVRNALTIIKEAEIYDKNLNIQFCLNDDKIYPKLYPFAGATAYAFLNKTVIYASTPNFKNNYTEFSWKINNYEVRKWNLTCLLAHEFMHNIQHYHNPNYYIKSTLGSLNWKFEGHAEYVSRKFKNDRKLKIKIQKYLREESKNHIGIPVFELEDGTIQSLSYYKYALVTQYLMEEKNMNYNQICELEMELEDLYKEMIDWSKK